MIGVNSPLRLLRENWSNPTALAQELYAMFTAKGPVELDDTLTIRVPENKTVLKIERQEAGDTYDFGQANTVTKQQVAADLSRIGQPATPTPRRQRPQDARKAASQAPADERRPSPPPIAPTDSPTRPWRKATTPLIEIDGPVKFSGKDPVSFEIPPTIASPETGAPISLIDFTAGQVLAATAGPSTATPTYIGQVSGTNPPDPGSTAANTFQVQLYPSGPGGAPGSTVTVIVPQLAPGEVIPNGTWIAPIFKFGAKYYCQVPVWLG